MHDDDDVWSALAETWLAVSLASITTKEALHDVARAIDVHADTACIIELEGGASPIASDRAAAAVLRAGQRMDMPLVSAEGHLLGRLFLFAPPPSLATERLASIVALVVGQHQLEARRQMLLHEINNRIAALLANVDFVEVLLEGATVDAPLLRIAAPEQRREFLSAIGNVSETARALAQLARRKRSAPP